MKPLLSFYSLLSFIGQRYSNVLLVEVKSSAVNCYYLIIDKTQVLAVVTRKIFCSRRAYFFTSAGMQRKEFGVNDSFGGNVRLGGCID